jgi:3-hydroxyisobutyrate dehydrogenase
MKVGFIGIGNMGWPMATNLVRAGHEVLVYDSNAERCAEFARTQGGTAARSPAEFAGMDFLITMLPTGAIVREVLLNPNSGVAQHLTAPTLVIDMSSSEPGGTRALGAELAKRGVVLLDAPVSGAVPRAKLGTLTIMLGGDDSAAMERAKPVLQGMGNQIFETGGLGTGHAMKALNNFVAGACYTAAAEALLIGRRFGLDGHRMIDIMNVSTGRNFNTEVVMKEQVLDRRFSSGFALGLLAKDVKIAADLAREVKFDAPMTRLVNDRYALARESLGASRDCTEALLSWDKPLAE